MISTPQPGLLVADAGPLIILAKCDQLHLLAALFGQLHLPQAVVDEVLHGGIWPETPRLRVFIQQAIVHEDIDNEWVTGLRQQLHRGESQALALAKQLDALVLMDELHGRRIAARESISVVGTLGVLLRAKQKGLLPAIAPVIQDMRHNDYALAASIVEHVMQLAGESL